MDWNTGMESGMEWTILVLCRTFIRACVARRWECSVLVTIPRYYMDRGEIDKRRRWSRPQVTISLKEQIHANSRGNCGWPSLITDWKIDWNTLEWIMEWIMDWSSTCYTSCHGLAGIIGLSDSYRMTLGHCILGYSDSRSVYLRIQWLPGHGILAYSDFSRGRYILGYSDSQVLLE